MGAVMANTYTVMYRNMKTRRELPSGGDESWKLDALEPTVLTGLIRGAVFELRDDEIWDSSVRMENNAKAQLKGVAGKWDKVVKAIK